MRYKDELRPSLAHEQWIGRMQANSRDHLSFECLTFELGMENQQDMMGKRNMLKKSHVNTQPKRKNDVKHIVPTPQQVSVLFGEASVSYELNN